MKLILRIEENDTPTGETVASEVHIDLCMLRAAKIDLLPALVDGLEASVKRELENRQPNTESVHCQEKGPDRPKRANIRQTL